MQKHLDKLDKLRTAMVQKRYPAKLVNQISRIYVMGYEENEERRQLKRERRKARPCAQ